MSMKLIFHDSMVNKSVNFIFYKKFSYNESVKI